MQSLVERLKNASLEGVIEGEQNVKQNNHSGQDRFADGGKASFMNTTASFKSQQTKTKVPTTSDSDRRSQSTHRIRHGLINSAIPKGSETNASKRYPSAHRKSLGATSVSGTNKSASASANIGLENTKSSRGSTTKAGQRQIHL